MENSNTTQFDAILKILKDRKIRLTDIRLSILEKIIELKHVSINDIINALNNDGITTNIMTVYNTISMLLANHILFTNSFNGKDIIYEILDNSICHLLCDYCGHIEHISNDALPSVELEHFKSIIKSKNWDFNHFKLEIHGKCSNCLAEKT